MSDDLDLPSADHLAIGTVGEPGRRVFYLQARLGAAGATVKIEKQHAAALATALAELLAEIDQPVESGPAQALEEPKAPDWVAGTIGMTPYDPATDRVILVVNELVEEGSQGATLRVGVSRVQMATLAAQAAGLVEAGRSPCPLCGFPMDPAGHSCPKTNGHLKH